MEYGAIDLHARQSLIRIVTSEGTVVLERTIPTRADKFLEVFGARASLRVVVESSTESEWVAQCLERCGHEVVVVDPNYALMYGHRGRHIKTDRRDVTALAEANRRGLYRAVHRVSAAQRQRRRTLRIREQLVRTRTQLINLLRAQLRQEGYRLPSGAAEAAVARLSPPVGPRGVDDDAGAPADRARGSRPGPRGGGRGGDRGGRRGSGGDAADDRPGRRPDHGAHLPRRAR
jgi:transposase